LSSQDVEQLFGGPAWILQVSCLLVDHGGDRGVVQVEKIENDLSGVSIWTALNALSGKSHGVGDFS